MISTGAIGYVGASTFDQHPRQPRIRDPWLALFALRMFPIDEIADSLKARGYSIFRLDGQTFRQRRFAGRDERTEVLTRLETLGIDPTGREAEGWYHAEFFIALPAGEIGRAADRHIRSGSDRHPSERTPVSRFPRKTFRARQPRMDCARQGPIGTVRTILQVPAALQRRFSAVALLRKDRGDMTSFRETLRGIVAISACNLLFLINDTMIKLANSELPLGELLFIRGLFASSLLLPIVVWTGAHRQVATAEELGDVPAHRRRDRRRDPFSHRALPHPYRQRQRDPAGRAADGHGVRGGLPRRQVGWKRWLAIAIGFAGVLIVVRPGLAGFNVFSLVALASMVFITLRDMTTRMMPRNLPALLVALTTGVAVCLTGPVLGVVSDEVWTWPSGRSFALMVGSAVFLIGGYLTAVDFMRHGDIAVIAPFRYSVVVWAIIVGFVVWGEVPDLMMLIGTAIIVVTGIYTFHRERRLARIVAESDIDI